jgi:hypothetical protein
VGRAPWQPTSIFPINDLTSGPRPAIVTFVTNKGTTMTVTDKLDRTKMVHESLRPRNGKWSYEAVYAINNSKKRIRVSLYQNSHPENEKANVEFWDMSPMGGSQWAFLLSVDPATLYMKDMPYTLNPRMLNNDLQNTLQEIEKAADYMQQTAVDLLIRALEVL